MATPTEAPSAPPPPNRPARAPRPFPGRSQARALPPRDPSSADDSWVDLVADEVQALLAEHGLEMELCVWFDPVAEVLHGVGFDGSPVRYFQSLGTGPSPAVGPKGPPSVKASSPS